MSDRSLDGLAARVDALERSNRSLKGLLIAIVGSLLVAGATTGPPKTIEAHEFVLKDDNGNIRARLGLSEMKYATSPAPGPVIPALEDALDSLDRERDSKPKIHEVTASIACLSFMGSSKQVAADQCTSWEDPAQSSLRFRVGQRDHLNVRADVDGAVLQLGGMRSRRTPQDRGRLALAAHHEGAWFKLEGPPNRATILDLDAVSFMDESGKPPRVFPAAPAR